MSALATVQAALREHGSKGGGGSWTCPCPAHEDSNPSLSVTEGRDGRVLLHCHAGCSFDAVMAALALPMTEAFAESPNGSGGAPPRSIVETYPYVDEEGVLLSEVVRYAPKDFRQRRPDPDDPGGWIWDLDGVRRVPYHLPALIAGVAAGATIYVVEGEKDVHAIERAGGTATCNLGGAGKWRNEYSEHLGGAEVVVVTDKDEPGKEHAAAVAAALAGIAAEVRVVGPASGKDAADHLAEGLGLDDFIPVDEAAEDGEPHPWTPIALDPETIKPPSPPSILAADDGQGALLYTGMRHLLFGETESLKSWVAAAGAVEMAHAGRDTVWIDTDGMGRAALVERLTALGLDNDGIRAHVLYLAPDVAIDAEGTSALIRVLDGRNVALGVIDAHDPALELQGLDPNSTADVQKFSRLVVDIFHRREIATLVPDHVARGGDGKDPIASQRKVSGFDVAIRIKLDGEPMTRSRPTARVELYGRKDRPGWHDRQGHERRLGEINFDLRATPPWKLVLARGDEAERPQVPSVLMERVSRFLEIRAEAVSMTVIEQSVSGKGTGIRWAGEVLLRLGYIETAPGRRSGDLVYRSTRPYREGDEDEPVPEPVPPKNGEPVPTRPGIRPSENPTAMRDSANPSQPVPNPSHTSPGNPSPASTPLQGVLGGTGSLERCAACGKRSVQTEPGEPLCECTETPDEAHRPRYGNEPW